MYVCTSHKSIPFTTISSFDVTDITREKLSDINIVNIMLQLLPDNPQSLDLTGLVSAGYFRAFVSSVGFLSFSQSCLKFTSILSQVTVYATPQYNQKLNCGVDDITYQCGANPNDINHQIMVMWLL